MSVSNYSIWATFYKKLWQKHLLDGDTMISCRACLDAKPSEVNIVLPEYRILFNQPSGIHRVNSVITDYL